MYAFHSFINNSENTCSENAKKIWRNLPSFFDAIWRFRQILVTFSEYSKFTKSQSTFAVVDCFYFDNFMSFSLSYFRNNETEIIYKLTTIKTDNAIVAANSNLVMLFNSRSIRPTLVLGLALFMVARHSGPV